MQQLRIVTLGISGGRWLTGARFATPAGFPRHDGTPYRGLRVRRWGLGACPSFKDQSLSRRAKP
jgi:hypothetical protein